MRCCGDSTKERWPCPVRVRARKLGSLQRFAVRFDLTQSKSLRQRPPRHVIRLLDRAKENLICLVGIGEQFVVIELYKEGNLVRILARHGAKYAERGGDGVASAFNRKLHNVFAIEIVGILCKACAGRVLNSLINRENREITCSCKATRVEHTLKTREYTRITVRWCEDAIDEVRAWQVQALFRNFRGTEPQKGICFRAEKLLNGTRCCGRCHFLRFSLCSCQIF